MTPRNVWALTLAACCLALASLRHRRQRHAACDRLPIMEGLALRGEWEGWWESEQADPSDEIGGPRPLPWALPEHALRISKGKIGVQWQS